MPSGSTRRQSSAARAAGTFVTGPPGFRAPGLPGSGGLLPYDHLQDLNGREAPVEPPESRPLLPSLRVDELLGELQVRLQAVLDTRDRVHALLEAVVAVGANLELEVVLRQIVEAAVKLVDARYGALGVVGEGGQLTEFVPMGLDEQQIAGIHHWPEGKGLLGELITHPRPLRLADRSAHPASASFPAGHPQMRSFLGAPVHIRGAAYGNLYLTEKNGGGLFDDEDEALLVALAAAAGVAIENARLYEDARRQERWLRASDGVTQSLLSGADPADVLEMIIQLSLELSGADLVVLALPTGDRKQLVIEHARGDGAAEALGLVLHVEDSVSGMVLASGRPVIVADFRADERVAATAREHIRLGPAVFVPLGAPGNVRGVLTAGRRPGAMPLAAPAVEMVTTFAAQAAIGLELAQHRKDAERIAVYEDRDRIARDLHDLVIQRLYATGLSLQSTTAQITEPKAAGRVSQAVDDLDETIKDIRSAIFALQSRSSTAPPTLRARILQVIQEMTGPLGFTPSLRVTGEVDGLASPIVAGHLLSVLREALSNVARHACASHAEITIDIRAGLVLIVRDNGTGMSGSTRRSGLANLDARATQLGGSLQTVPADGGGTELRWQVPLPPAGPPAGS